MKRSVYTVGHSTLAAETFTAALLVNECELLVDVRRFPMSRRYPHFASEALADEMRGHGMRYLWMPELGGRRRPAADSKNDGWRNESFRGYADYMQTDEFRAAVKVVAELAGQAQVVILCAEAVPWRCHRSLIADALMVRGFVVEDIFVGPGGKSERRPHVITSFAVAKGDEITYPKQEGADAQGSLFRSTGSEAR